MYTIQYFGIWNMSTQGKHYPATLCWGFTWRTSESTLSLVCCIWKWGEKKSVKSTVQRWRRILNLCRIFNNPYRLILTFWKPLTCLCLICRYVQYQVLKGHLGLGHITESIWTIKLKQKNIILAKQQTNPCWSNIKSTEANCAYLESL